MKKSFVLYTDYNEQLKLLTDVQKGILFQAIMDYAIDGDAYVNDPIVNIVFSFIKSQMDRDTIKWEQKAEAGRKGGLAGKGVSRNIGNQNARQKQTKANNSKTIHNVNVNVNDNVILLSDIERFCEDEHLTNVNPKAFFDYYSKQNWMCKGEPIKDWKALIRTWNSNIKSKGFQQRDYDYEELEKEVLAN